MRILATETIANMPPAVHFLLLMVGRINTQVETEQLGIIGLQAILHVICIQFMIGKSHLQVKAVGVVHDLWIAVLIISRVYENDHAKHFKLTIRFTSGRVLPKRGQSKEIADLCRELQ